MTLRIEVLLLILGCMAVTVVPRILPMALLGRVELPRWFLLWLRFIPTAVISALLFKEVFLRGGEWRALADPYLVGGLVAVVIAFLSRRIFVTVFGGAAVFYLLRLWA